MKDMSFWARNSFSKSAEAKKATHKVILSYFPYGTYKYTTLEQDKLGIDLIVEQFGTKYNIDLKIREKDYCITPNRIDVGLESISHGKVGWALDDYKQTDLVLFIYLDTGRTHLYNFNSLKAIFKANLERWEVQKDNCLVQTTDNGRSEVIFVPTGLLKQAEYELKGEA